MPRLHERVPVPEQGESHPPAMDESAATPGGGAAAAEQAPADSSSKPRRGDAWKRRDVKARLLEHMVRLRSGLPGWHVAALGNLAKSEAEGVRVLERALPAIRSEKLRTIFQKHIKDEHRHTAGFTDLYEKLSGKKLERSGAEPALKMHVVGLFAYLEITELRGEEMIGNYYRLYQDYPEVQAFMQTVLRDERYHASYLHAQLEEWIRDGIGKEVARARRAAARIDTRGFLTQLAAFLGVLPRIVLWRVFGRGVGRTEGAHGSAG